MLNPGAEPADKWNSITILKKIPKAVCGFMKEFNNKDQNIIQFFLKTKMEQEEILFPPGAWGLVEFISIQMIYN